MTSHFICRGFALSAAAVKQPSQAQPWHLDSLPALVNLYAL